MIDKSGKEKKTLREQNKHEAVKEHSLPLETLLLLRHSRHLETAGNFSEGIFSRNQQPY